MPAKNSAGSYCAVSFLCRANGALVLILALLCGSKALAQSDSTKAKLSLWQTYVDSAVEANAANDFPGAEVFLKSAQQLADEADPRGPRPTLSRLLVYLNNIDLGRDEAADKLEETPPDISGIDQSLLRFTQTIEHLFSTYYGRRNTIDSKRQAYSHGVMRCLQIKAQIEQKLLPDSLQLATTLGYQALIFMDEENWKEAIQQFKGALQISDQLDQDANKLAAGGQAFSLFPSESHGVSSQQGSEFLSIKGLLGNCYRRQGDALAKQKQRDQSYKDAEVKLKAVAQTLWENWPDHSQTATVAGLLARAYRALGRDSDAELWDRRSRRGTRHQ